jgi:hypothetical protein
MMIAGRDYLFLCVADGCWGKGFTEEQAIFLACTSAGRKIRSYNLYLCDKSTTVNECGDITWWRGKGRKNLILLKRVSGGKVQEPPVEKVHEIN